LLAQLSPKQAAVLDAEFEQRLQSEHLPSLSVAILRDGKVEYIRAFGYADVEKKVPASTHTLYRLASISKAITAVAVMQLAESKKVSLDGSAAQFCPAFASHSEVTTRQLLSHRSGVHHPGGNAGVINTTHYASLSDSVRSFADYPLNFEAGKGFEYTSYGYTVLGCEIEGASGESYEAYVRAHIFKPAKMTETMPDDSRVNSADKATFYTMEGDKLEQAPALDISDRLPGGGWLSTPSEMVGFGRAVMEHKLLDARSTALMWTETTKPGEAMRYGLGWSVGSLAGHPVVGHGGGQAGTSTSLLLVPDSHLAVAVFTNRDGADMVGLSLKIAAELLGLKIQQ
jgi:CubicO group peptidase (beta-lactamase class C family)